MWRTLWPARPGRRTQLSVKTLTEKESYDGEFRANIGRQTCDKYVISGRRSQGQTPVCLMTAKVICIDTQIYGCSALCDKGDDLGLSHVSRHTFKFVILSRPGADCDLPI